MTGLQLGGVWGGYGFQAHASRVMVVKGMGLEREDGSPLSPIPSAIKDYQYGGNLRLDGEV